MHLALIDFLSAGLTNKNSGLVSIQGNTFLGLWAKIKVAYKALIQDIWYDAQIDLKQLQTEDDLVSRNMLLVFSDVESENKVLRVSISFTLLQDSYLHKENERSLPLSPPLSFISLTTNRLFFLLLSFLHSILCEVVNLSAQVICELTLKCALLLRHLETVHKYFLIWV